MDDTLTPHPVQYVKTGDVVGERYCVESMIGEGAAASIWRAVQLDLQRDVALKVRHGGPQSDLVRFEREARLSAAITHRNVVQIYEFGRLPDNQTFIAMEYLEGESLAELLHRRRVSDGEAFRWIASILNGLSAVHDAGVVHRDLKPENIFLVEDSDGFAYPKILDFGVSKVDSEGSAAPGLRSAIPTIEGLVVGTPQYMPPEQARGDVDVDFRADIYAVAASLYELLTGEPPYDAESPVQVVALLLNSDYEPVATRRPDLPQAIIDIIDCGLSMKREDRYATAEQMKRALTDAREAIAEDTDSKPNQLVRGEAVAVETGTNSSPTRRTPGAFVVPLETPRPSGRENPRSINRLLLAAGFISTLAAAGVIWAIPAQDAAATEPTSMSQTTATPASVHSAVQPTEQAGTTSGDATRVPSLPSSTLEIENAPSEVAAPTNSVRSDTEVAQAGQGQGSQQSQRSNSPRAGRQKPNQGSAVGQTTRATAPSFLSSPGF